MQCNRQNRHSHNEDGRAVVLRPDLGELHLAVDGTTEIAREPINEPAGDITNGRPKRRGSGERPVGTKCRRHDHHCDYFSAALVHERSD